MYEYSGAIHIHSTYSDGTSSIEDISKAAAESGLDFIIMTDHNTIKPKEDGYDRWINDVLVINGYEVNDMQNKNHYLAIGVDELIGSYQKLDNGELGCILNAREYVKKIKEKGGIGIIAHPDEERQENGHIAYPWTEWDIDDFTGIELWNHMSEWVEGMKNNNKVKRFLHPLKTITAPSAKTLKRWDELALRRQISPIGSVDAHAFKQNVMGVLQVEIFPYKVLFKSIRTNVYLNEVLHKKNKSKYQSDKQAVIEAIKYGSCYINNFYYGSSKGFRYVGEYKNKFYIQGETINKKAGEQVLLKVYVPKSCRLNLIYNGEKIENKTGTDGEWLVSNNGVYRVECWNYNKAWIFSNHIRIVNEE